MRELTFFSLSETHLSENSRDCLRLDGYNFVFRNREHGTGGGVAMFIKDNIIYKRRIDLEKNFTECIWIEIFVKHSKSFLVVCFYRPPGTSKYTPRKYNDLLREHLSTIMKVNKETIIVGDFNVNYNDTTDNTDFKTIINHYGFKQMIKKATRITSIVFNTNRSYINKPSINTFSRGCCVNVIK